MASSLPKTQRAIIFNTTTNALSLSTTTPIPEANDSELLIRVHATAITNGELTWGPFVNWPVLRIPCCDVSGTIITSPSSSFKPGDRVYGRIMADREGAASEYATILVSEAALVPEDLGMLDAASVPMSAHTAWQAVFEKGLLTGSFDDTGVPHVNDKGEAVLGQAKGKRVLILGAAGGVGLMAVQFAKLAGAHVVGTASARNKEYLQELGIDEVVDYTKVSIEEYVASGNDKFDLVFDCAGGKSMVDGWNGVKDDGAYISVVPGFREPEHGKPVGVRSTWFVMVPRGEELSRIGRFFEKGSLKATVDSVWALEDFEGAFGKTASGHARGKVVFRVCNGV
ncbi:NAD(P)-binding protein [Ophiobolus disseminans]|uniref:NAD(P)-binding protein n=1 Tax=Ophiobolus disseminans TaxID=1469910 RepID=A0A6A6ZYA0_9PLEO|nr:NAD(P)-binding protein [Ophiobolus disseminans]